MNLEDVVTSKEIIEKWNELLDKHIEEQDIVVGQDYQNIVEEFTDYLLNNQ